MQLLEDETGSRYLLLTRASTSSLVYDLESGEREYRPNSALRSVGGTDVLCEAADTVSQSVRERLDPLPGERALGLVVLIGAHDGMTARTLLEMTPYCESDLFAVTRELEAGGVLEATRREGEQVYALSEEAKSAIDQS